MMDLLAQLERMMRAFQLNMICIKASDFNSEMLDFGLRRFLHIRAEEDGGTKMERYFASGTVYVVRDSMEEYHITFLLPEHLWKAGKKRFVVIGPYIMEPADDIMQKLRLSSDFPMEQFDEIRQYYYSVPYIASSDAVEELVLMQLQYLMQASGADAAAHVKLQHFQISDDESAHEEREEGEQEAFHLSMRMIEERYHIEDQMLDAIRMGDADRVFAISHAFERYRLTPRQSDSLRNTKNLMFVWNTLFRKAVQQADVHPFYIDRVSEQFARKIEECGRIHDLEQLSHEMTRKYCLLVRNHSLRGYSQMVKNALSYIDFHLAEPLSLKMIAEKLSVNASYLSTQFKIETGSTLTDHVNEKRIHAALPMLATTELPIQEIAARVGILDENYFARLFKKYQGQSARQYRSLLRGL